MSTTERGVAIGGNVSNSPIITGDGNTVRQVGTAFDQRGQNVLGPQTNIAGDVNTSGGIFNSGIMNTGTSQSQPNLLVELRKLHAAITQAGQQGILNDDTAVDAAGAIQKAINQADKATADPQVIRKHLTAAKALLQPLPGARGLLTLIDVISGLAL